MPNLYRAKACARRNECIKKEGEKERLFNSRDRIYDTDIEEKHWHGGNATSLIASLNTMAPFRRPPVRAIALRQWHCITNQAMDGMGMRMDEMVGKPQQ